MKTAIIKRLMSLNLSESSRQEINGKLPNVGKVSIWLTSLPQEWIDEVAGPKSKLPIAKVCLQDAANVACQVDYALEQAYAHLIWFKQECPGAPKELEAFHYSKFYVEDSTLRLYAAAEHAANFIVNFLDIDKTELKTYRKGDKFSAQAVLVGKYLRKQKSTHPVTEIVNHLLSKEWTMIRNYRNDWVHNKPPILDGPRLDYRRKNVWKTIGEMQVRPVGYQYEPDYELVVLLEATTKAANDFKDALAELTDLLFEELEDLGIKRDFEAGAISPPDFW